MLSDPRFITLDAQAKARLSQRRKCVVCSALRLAHEVVRAVHPALCREHFDPRCFTDNHELRACAVPTLPKGNTTAAVMRLLRKAKAELAKILPGTFIPREDTWLRIERGDSIGQKNRTAAVASPKRKTPNLCDGQPLYNGVPKKESQIYASSYRGDKEIKKEEDDYDLHDWTQSNAAGSMAIPGSSNDGESNTGTAVPPSKRRSARPRKSYSPTPPISRNTGLDSVEQDDTKVTTRSGRLVKRKKFDVYDAPQQLCGGQTKRARGGRAESTTTLHADTSADQLRPPPGSINPITGEITPYEEDVKPDMAQLNSAAAACMNAMVAVKKEEMEDGYLVDSFDKEPFGNWEDFEKKQKLIDHIAHDHCYYA
ncbi:hypothetical protein PRIPAC_91548 [Pristionchus pacificus]|uniref:Uncharacterized protein n=1 Tax=Pristionchus pacificus TaxID=54126 RepID=A0A2A6BQS0_PRIPA|nr:hypothetical protein PRIPAC_91548 [Pristionchus pacificus]|eukprot:PDM68111.1 hypothetical protein PRIPAC_46155 [Pristionchus pacificus]